MEAVTTDSPMFLVSMVPSVASQKEIDLDGARSWNDLGSKLGGSGRPYLGRRD